MEFVPLATRSRQIVGGIVADLLGQERRYDQPYCISAQLWYNDIVDYDR